ncbi:MAG: DUF2384 domain-containing protein [Thioalkalispiraceae bacterium]|jgi:hypothetical protein
MSEQTLNNEDRVNLTRAIMNILDSWGMQSAEQVAILDLPAKTPNRMLRRYRDDTPFPDTKQVMARLEHIIGIADALRTTYPHNPSMGSIWMKRRNSRFQQRSPLQLIKEEGLDGIIKVRTHLDCSFDWFEYKSPADQS